MLFVALFAGIVVFALIVVLFIRGSSDTVVVVEERPYVSTYGTYQPPVVVYETGPSVADVIVGAVIAEEIADAVYGDEVVVVDDGYVETSYDSAIDYGNNDDDWN